jgi:hypothetical protein
MICRESRRDFIFQCERRPSIRITHPSLPLNPPSVFFCRSLTGAWTRGPSRGPRLHPSIPPSTYPNRRLRVGSIPKWSLFVRHSSRGGGAHRAGAGGGGRGKCQWCCCCCWIRVTRLDLNGDSVYSLGGLGSQFSILNTEEGRVPYVSLISTFF